MQIDLRDVRVEYDGRVILDVPALRVQPQRTTAILGANGAGKTTLLRVVAGLEPIGKGSVTVDGSDRTTAGVVSYVFQEDVFLRRSVRDNVRLGLELRGIAPRDVAHRADEAIERLRIVHLADRRADLLSGGERRRVSLARALALHSPIMLLDEPLAGLDGDIYDRLLDHLPDLLEAQRATTLLVTHERDEALRLAHDLVIVADGRVLASGSKAALVGNPQRPDVARALGYVVLTARGRHIAVPPAEILVGEGPYAFALFVERVIDMVDHRELVGRIADVRVRVAYGDGRVPLVGSMVTVHARRWLDLD